MTNFLENFFAGLIKTGSIEIETAGGHKFTVGDGSSTKLGLRFNSAAAPALLMLDLERNFGELYMDGRIEVTQGTLFDVLMLFAAGICRPDGSWRPDGTSWLRLTEKRRAVLGWLGRANGLLRARRNAAYHYDLDTALYRKFLDSGLQYSCAYFEREGENLENAQLAKKRHIAAKLLVEPGQTILDIGCGFGGMAAYLARFCGATVTGITLSQTQLSVAKAAAAGLGLSTATDFRLCDYREIDASFDRIVSVGMFEHVGLAYYDMYFRKVAQLLVEDGIALISTVGRPRGPCPMNPWITKYIFPGSYLPALSEIMSAIERSGLIVTDIEVLRLHYAETLKAWRERFAARRAEVGASRGERFCRMWELYLTGCEVGFRREGLVVFQIQLAKKLDRVPLTRDYIARAEAYLRERDSAAAYLQLAGE